MTLTDPPPPPTILLSDKLMAITNLTNIIPVKLDMDEMNYSSWVYFFTHFCRGNQLLDHIESKNATDTSTNTTTPHDAEWLKIDSILLSWIFVTVSKTLQQRLVVENPKMAKDAWDTLATIFSDNKRTRSIALKAELRSLKLGDMGIDAYFRKIESIATVLNSLGSTLDNDDIVTFALEGLPSRYDNVATIIAHRDPFPDLKTVRSMLTTEEMRHKARSHDPLTDSSASSPMALLANTGSNTRRSFTSMDKVHKPCNNFLKGYCRFGASCRFLHNGVHGSNEQPTSNTVTPSDMQNLQLLLAKLGCSAPTIGPPSITQTPKVPTAYYTSPPGFGLNPSYGPSAPPVQNPQQVMQQSLNPSLPYPVQQFTNPNLPPVQHQQSMNPHQQMTGQSTYHVLQPGQSSTVQQFIHPGQYLTGQSAVQPHASVQNHLGILGPSPGGTGQSTSGGNLGAVSGQETILPHAFATTTLHEPTPGNWNMDTDSSGAAPL